MLYFGEIIHYCRALSFCSVTRLSKTDQSACWAIYRSFWALSNQFRLAAWFRLLALLPKEPFTLITGRHCVAFILTYSFGWAGVKSLRTSSPCDRGNLGEYAQSILSLITEYAFASVSIATIQGRHSATRVAAVQEERPGLDRFKPRP